MLRNVARKRWTQQYYWYNRSSVPVFALNQAKSHGKEAATLVDSLLAEAKEAARIVANIMEATTEAGIMILAAEEEIMVAAMVEGMQMGTHHHQLAITAGRSVI